MFTVEDFEKFNEERETSEKEIYSVKSTLPLRDAMLYQEEQTAADKALEVGSNVLKSLYNGSVVQYGGGAANFLRGLHDVNVEQLNREHPERMQGDSTLLEDIANSSVFQPYEVKADTAAGEYAYNLVQGAGQLAVQIPASMALGPVGAGALMGMTIAGQDYKELREQGVDQETSLKAGAIDAAIQAPLESIGLGAITKSFPANTLLKQQVRSVILRGLEEGATEWAEQYPDEITKIWALNKDKSMDEILQLVIDALPSITKHGIYAGSIGWVLGGGVSGVNLAIDRVTGRHIEHAMERAAQREAYTARMEQEESRINRIKESGENPARAAVIINGNMQNQEVHVDGEALYGYAQKAGAEKVAESLGVSVEEIEKAAADGDTVDIKLGNYEATGASFDGFLDAVRDDTAFEDGGYTVNKDKQEQAWAAAKKQQEDAVRTELDRIEGEMKEAAKAAGIKADVTKEMINLLSRARMWDNPAEVLKKLSVRYGENAEGYAQFAGENAETADKVKLAEAQQMETEGKAADEIYKQTGWFKGLDNKWRFEVADNLNDIDLSGIQKLGELPLVRVYYNEALFNAYPILRTVKVKVDPNMEENTNGEADVLNFEITLNGKHIGDEAMKSTLVHEVAHMIQTIENFAAGGSVDDVRDALKTLGQYKQEYDNLDDFTLYERIGGEQEAREVARRARIEQNIAAANERIEQAKQNGNDEEVRRATFAKTFFERRKNQMPTPHTSDALIVFDDIEIPYSQKRDESPAGEKTAAEKWNKNKLDGRLHTSNIINRINDDMAYDTVQGLILGRENAVLVNALSIFKRQEKQRKDTRQARESLVNAVGDAIGRRRALNDAAGAAYVGRFLLRNGKARKNSYLGEDVRRILDAGRDRNVSGNRISKADQERYNGFSGEHKQTFTDPIVDEIIAEIGEARLNQIADEFIADLEEIEINNRQAQSRSNQSGFSYAQNRKGDYNPATNIITLFKGADASTVIHETWHFFVEQMWQTVQDGTASEQTVKDFETLLNYAGMTMEEWSAADADGRRKAHEKLAEAGETYIMEGNAPSHELRRVFKRFAQWLKDVYRTLQRSENYAELTDEVREVFDRMLAAEDDIAEMERINGYFAKLPDVITDNMSDETRAKVEDYIAKAREKAEDILTRRYLRNYVKDRREQIKKFKEEIRPSVEREVDNYPVYKCGYTKKDVERYRRIKAQEATVGVYTAEDFIDRAFSSDRPDLEDVAKLAAVTNPDNWMEGLDEVKADYQRRVDETMQNAREALERGMGNGVDIVQDPDSGRYLRVSKNEPWYREFWKQHKRKPNKSEMEEMVRQLATNDPNAPKVEGWTATDEETAKALQEQAEQFLEAERRVQAADEVRGQLADIEKNYRVTKGADVFLLNADLAAEQNGFSSADEMMKAVEAAPTKSEAVKQRINERVLELSPESERDFYENAIHEALYNEDEALLIGVEQQIIEEYANAEKTKQIGEGIERNQVEAIKAEQDLAKEAERGKKEAERQEAREQKRLEKEADKIIRRIEREKAKDTKAAVAEGKKLYAKQMAAIAAAKRQQAMNAAREDIAKMNVKEATRTSKYITAERNAAVKAAQLLAKKKYDEALTQKNLQAYWHAMVSESIKIARRQKQYEKFLKKQVSLKREAWLNDTHFGAISLLFDRMGIAKAKHKEAAAASEFKTLQEYAAAMEGQFDCVDIAPWILEGSTPISDTNALTLEQYEDVVNAVKNIKAIVKAQKGVNTFNRQETWENTKAFIMEKLSVLPTIWEPNPNRATKTTVTEEYNAETETIDTFFERMDNDSYGYFSQVWLNAIKHSADREYDYTEKYNKATADALKEWLPDKAAERAANEEVFYKELNNSVTKHTLVRMLINLGSKENSQRLCEMLPGGFKPSNLWIMPDEFIDRQTAAEQTRQNLIDFLGRVLTKEDVEYAQRQIDAAELTWGDYNELERRTKGFGMKKKEATPVILNIRGEEVVLRGGYFPLMRYGETGSHAAAQEVAEDEPLKGRRIRTYHTNTSATKAVTQARYPVDLRIGMERPHIYNSIHDICWRETMNDFRRVLNDQELYAMMKSKLGAARMEKFKDLLEVSADPVNSKAYSENAKGLSRSLTWIRQTTAHAVIMLNPKIPFQNYADMFLYGNAIEGYTMADNINALGRRMLTYHFSREQYKKYVDFVFSKSAFMRERAKIPDITIRDIIDDNKEWQWEKFSRELGTQAIVYTDNATAIPNWIEAYNKKINEGAMEQEAIDFADALVRRVKGSSRIVDVAPIQRGGAYQKLLTMFQSFFITRWNEFKRMKRTSAKQWTEGQKMEAFANVFIYAVCKWMGQAALAMALAFENPLGVDDEDKWPKLIKELKNQTFSMMGPLGQIGNVITGSVAGMHEYTYRMSAVESMIENMNRSLKKLHSDKATTQDKIEGITSTALRLARVPAEVDRIFWNLIDIAFNGMSPEIGDIMRRRPKNERK